MIKKINSAGQVSDLLKIVHFGVALAVLLMIGPGASRVLAADELMADQLDLRSVNPSQFMNGSTRNLAFDVGLPASGYEGDQLNRLNVVNAGNARYENEISRMEAWADNGDGLFDQAMDTHLGEFIFTGSRWRWPSILRQ